MGGSLGLAARRRGLAVTAYARSAESRAAALETGVADEVYDTPGDAVDGADLVVLCTPILTMPALVESFRNRLAAGSIVTDVGSTKNWLTGEIDALLCNTSSRFVGSHPMAGSEKTGLAAAVPDLYQDATVFVTLEKGRPDAATSTVAAFWESIGARVILMTPRAHDDIVARTSHLPHLVASLLMNTVAREADTEDLGSFCGPGLRDATRIAEGSEYVWHDIIKSNRRAVLEELDAFSEQLDELRDMLAKRDFESLRKLLRSARQKRSRL